MTVSVKFPYSFYRLTGNISTIEAQGTTVCEVVEELETMFPGLKDQLYDAEGELRPSIHISVNGEDIQFLHGLQTNLEDQARVSIFRAIAGGAF